MLDNNFKIAVLISGGGTTLRNLIEYRDAGKLMAEFVLVISSTPNAGGLRFAEDAGIETLVLNHRERRTASEISDPIFEACRQAQVDLVVMGGFLRQVIIPDDFANRVVNIHPSLIPAFCGKGMYGKRVHQAVLDKKSLITGCTVHFVDNEFDHGPIVAQESVLVAGCNSAEELAAKVFETECELFPRVINAIAMGLVNVVGDEVVVGD